MEELNIYDLEQVIGGLDTFDDGIVRPKHDLLPKYHTIQPIDFSLYQLLPPGI